MQKKANDYNKYMKYSFIASIILFSLAGFFMFDDQASADQPSQIIRDDGVIIEKTVEGFKYKVLIEESVGTTDQLR